MKYEIPEEQVKKAKAPHELFLTNLIGNHILWFVAALGVYGSFWQPMALVPVPGCDWNPVMAVASLSNTI